MKFIYTPERLTLTCDEAERAELREILEENGHFSDRTEAEFMDHLICNSELDWINPDDTGDMTDAPMLGVWGEDVAESQRDGFTGERLYGWVQLGRWHNAETGRIENHYSPILERWAYPHYAVRSFLSDLMENGEAVFLSNW